MEEWGTCPYLEDRSFRVFRPVRTPPGPTVYRHLMDHRFRRSGTTLYMPMCPDCQECRPIRVDVAAFAPHRDQRRCLRTNADVVTTWEPRAVDEERFALFQRYEAAVHDRPRVDIAQMAYLGEDGGVPGGELQARDTSGRLLAVTSCDRLDGALSAVYCYYDPELPARSLGKLMILRQIELCRRDGIPWLYLGFLVRDCPKLAYKALYFPHEVLEDGAWVRYETPARPGG